LRDAELLQGGDQMTGGGVELLLGDPHPGVGGLHVPTGVLEWATQVYGRCHPTDFL
jgi:hypothetical protein